MTLLSPLDGTTDESASDASRHEQDPHLTSEACSPALSPTLAVAQASYLRSVPAASLPPLTITTDLTVPAAEATPLRLRDEADVRDAVGRFAAATLLPASAAETTREHVRDNWARAVTVLPVASHPDWMLAYIPGAHVGDAMVHAVHLTTGHVFGGDTGPTVQQRGESTHLWLDRLTTDFETHAADYTLGYVAHGHHA